MSLDENHNHEQGKGRNLKSLSLLNPYILRYRGMVAAALFFLALAASMALVLPLAVRRMIDQGLGSSDARFIDNYFAMLIVLATVTALASAMRYYYVITIGDRIVTDLRRDVFNHVNRLSPAFFDTNQSGEIVSRLTSDATQLKSAIGASTSIALRNGIMCIGAVVMMIYTSPKLSVMVLAAIPVIVFPLIAFGRSVRRRSRLAQDRLAVATTYAGESIAAARTVQAFNGEGAAEGYYRQALEDAYEAGRVATRSRAILTGVAISLVFGSIVGVLWYGAQSVLAGAMSAGTLGQFVLYAVLAGSSVGQLTEVWGELMQASGAAERLSELLNEVSAVRSPAQPEALPTPARGEVWFDDVEFAYPSRPDSRALKGLSFAVEAGETVAIVGPSGAGKSTIFSLILRFYDPASGRICLDGIDMRKVSLSDLRDRLAIVPQDVTIFSGTIHDNIAFGSPKASRADVIAAARAAQAGDFIDRLDKGYDTPVGERGITLSGGQRQRIAIARAILKNAPVLLLDEATSALDAESETMVQKGLDELMKARTTIVVAHRLATVLKADRILVVDQGRVVEQGTHASLIQQGGLYAKLARMQFESGAEALSAVSR